MELVIKIDDQTYNKFLRNEYSSTDVIAIEAVTRLDDRCRECEEKYGKPLKQEPCDDAISRQSVIGSIFDDDTEYTGSEICSMVRNLPSVKPQYTDDEIKKMQDLEQAEIQKAYELGKAKTGHWIENLCDSCTNKACEFQSGILRSKRVFYIPPMPHLEPDNCGNYVVQQEPKTGHWIYGEDTPGTGRDGWFCNQCGHFESWDYSLDMKSAKLNLPNPCPNCGAKMAQESEE